LRYGDPIDCILEAAVRGHANLIVMGTEGCTGWDRLRIGSTAEGVVCKAPCPVLTIHGGLAGDVFRHPAKVRLRRILLGTDFSRDAASALQVVRGLALKLHATVRIVHGSQASADNGHVDRRIAKQARDLRSAGVEADGVCVPGDPVETI
jgi:nucleotide-binding universal stress UspA family protein